MTAVITNELQRVKITIDGVTSTYAALIVDSLTNLTVGETVIGRSSNASGVIYSLVTDTKNYVLIKERSGFFIYNEILDGSIYGTDAANVTEGQTFYTTNYNNATLGIVDGLWTIYSDGDLSVKIKDSVRKINISNGGNYGTGYTFGFDLLNFDLVAPIIEDGVFLKNLIVKYYVCFGAPVSVDVNVWTGILDTYPKVGSIKASFTCKDNMKNKSNKIGSDLVPICLNKNENCKLVPVDGKGNPVISKYVFNSDEDTKYYKYDHTILQVNTNYIEDDQNPLFGNFVPIGEDLNTILLRIPYTSPWINTLENEQGLSIIVSFGNGANDVYKILNVEKRSTYEFISVYLVYLDKSTSSLTPIDVSISSPERPANLIRLITYGVDYNLSEKTVKTVNTFTDKTQKGLTIYDNNVETYLSSPENYTHDYQKVYVTGLDKDKSIEPKNKIELDTLNASDSTEIVDLDNDILLRGYLDVFTIIPLTDLLKLNNDENDLYFELESLEYNTDITGTGLLLIKSYPTYPFKVTAYGVAGRMYYTDQKQEFFNEELDFDLELDNGKVTITPLIPYKSLKFDGFAANDIYTNIYIKIEAFIGIAKNATTANLVTGKTYNNFNYVYYTENKLEDPSIGCVGQNMVGETEDYEGYPDTIKYLETEYNDIDISEIDTASYDQAVEDFDNFPGVTGRNPAHQLIEQSEFNDVLKDLLFNSHLCLFPSRTGLRTMRNWLWKSAVFSDAAITDQFRNFKKIGTIKRSSIDNVISDFELFYDYSEAQDKFLKKMRIKNTDLEFSFTDGETGSVEGVPAEFQAEANEAFNLGSIGEKRIKKQSKTSFESKWIKFDSEAICFILNQLGHLNREHERIDVTLPLLYDYVIKELLDFDLINGGKSTENEDRLGWVEQIRISWEKKEVTFTYFLDISDKDPFLYEVNPIQDLPDDSLDVIEDDVDELNILEDTGY